MWRCAQCGRRIKTGCEVMDAHAGPLCRGCWRTLRGSSSFRTPPTSDRLIEAQEGATARALAARRRELDRQAYERKFRSVAPATHEEAPLFVKPEPVTPPLPRKED